MYKQFLKCRSAHKLAKYKRYKNKLTSVLRYAEKSYYNDLLLKHKGSTKNIWMTLNGLIKNKASSSSYPEEFNCNGNVIKGSKNIADGFNDFFVNVGPTLAKKIKDPPNNMHVYDFMKNSVNKTMFLADVDDEELNNIIKKCKSKMSTDVNDINMSIVKEIFSSIVQPFKYVCNLSLNSGVFPDRMKTAKVIPLFKSGENNVFTNYRPVSLLPQFSKLLEKIFNSRLDSFLDKHNVLTDGQYGFRSARSTSQALIDLLEKINNCY